MHRGMCSRCPGQVNGMLSSLTDDPEVCVPCRHQEEDTGTLQDSPRLKGWLFVYSLPMVLVTKLRMAAVRRSGRSTLNRSRRSNSGSRFQSPGQCTTQHRLG